MSDKPSGKQPKAGKLPTPTMKRGIGGFFKDLQREARQVSWPTPQETTRLTGTVVAVCALVSGFLFLLTLLIRAVFQMLGVQ
jgi:preprotein translocase SecE subunit